MKKIISILLLTISMSAFADGRHRGPAHGHWQRHGHGWTWVVPAIIGGAIVYQATRPVVVQQPPIMVQQPQLNCSPWTEIQNPDGSITRTRTCY